MNIRVSQIMKGLIVSILFIVGVVNIFAQNKTNKKEIGILLLAHGGKAAWNEEVKKIAAKVSEKVPVEVAFGMATKANIQGAIDKLNARGVTEIVAVPMFVSSHSSVITSTQFLLGLRPDAPADLEIFAAMSHGSEGHGGHGAAPAQTGSHNGSAGDGGATTKVESHENHKSAEDLQKADPMKPVVSKASIRWTRALDNHPIVEDILLSRAKSISETPANEVVVVVAHGPVKDDENQKWLADMNELVGAMRKHGNFKRIEYMTVRDDAPPPIRNKATAELRAIVEKATLENSRVLIVPLLLSYGGIEAGVQKRLDGLTYTMCKQALLPDERLVKWVEVSAGI